MKPGFTALLPRIAAACLAVLLLAGCGSTSSELKADTAARFQERFLAVTQAVARDDHTAALASLDELAADLETEAANSGVSPVRHQSIRQAIELVQADIIAARNAASPPPPPAPAPAPAPEETPKERGKGKDGDKDED